MNSNDDQLRKRLMRDFEGYEVEPSADFWDRLAPALPPAKPPISKGIVAALLVLLLFVPVVSGDWQTTHSLRRDSAPVELARVHQPRRPAERTITPHEITTQLVKMPAKRPEQVVAATPLETVMPVTGKTPAQPSLVQVIKGTVQRPRKRSFSTPTLLSGAGNVPKPFAPAPAVSTPAFVTDSKPNSESIEPIQLITEPILDASFRALSTYSIDDTGYPTDTPPNAPMPNEPTQQHPARPQFGWQLAFSPLLAYNTITPTVQEGVVVQHIQTESTLSGNRVGWQAEVGFVKSVTRRGQVTGSIVFRQFHQAISYEVPNGTYDVTFTGPNTAIVKRVGDAYHLSQFTRQMGLRVAYEQTMWSRNQSGLVVGVGGSTVMSLTGSRMIPSVDVSAMFQRGLTAPVGFRVGLYMNYTLESQLDPVFRRISWQPYQTGLRLGLAIGHK